MNLKEIRQLIKLLADTDVVEIEVREGEQIVRINRQVAARGGAVAAFSQPMVAHMNMPLATPDNIKAREEELPSVKTVAITSPMVGTYYHAASPDALPFVSRGDVIKKGQVVCIIEAMKLMNEIESEYSGKVVSILKENASPLEYGETLFVVEPV